MNKELFMVFLPPIAGLLGALGGTQISSKIPGWKGWRRIILPIVFFISVILVASWWQALLVAAIAGASFSLGYGHKKTWLERSFTFLAYGLISIPIGISFWNLFTVFTCIVLFVLSNNKIFAKTFVWKICELLMFMICGIQLAYILMGNGLSWLK